MVFMIYTLESRKDFFPEHLFVGIIKPIITTCSLLLVYLGKGGSTEKAFAFPAAKEEKTSLGLSSLN